MIRTRVLKSVKETMDSHKYFDSIDFTVSTKAGYGGTSLIIVYNLDDRYTLNISIPNQANDNGSYDFSGTIAPGPLSFEEKIKFSKEEDLYKKITLWMNCIWGELCADPVLKEVDKQREEINKILETLSEVPDEYFSKEEITTLVEKLNKFEQQLKDEIERNTNNKKDLEKKIQDLNGDIENLKITLSFSKKEGWRKNFVTKVYKWFKDPTNRKMLGDGYKVIKELLPEHHKAALPDNPE